MPNSPSLWMAAGLLWILDSSINISMEPFRAFVADKLPENQRTLGFSMQSLFIGLGSIVASSLPWILTHWFNVNNVAATGEIPYNVKISFYIGAAAFITFVMYTVFTTKEYPPTEEEIAELKNKKGGIIEGFKEITQAILNMPKRMKQLALVQFLTWPGLFLMWFYYTPAVGNFIYGGSADASSQIIVKDWITIVDQGKLMYTRGTEFAGLTYSFQNIITFLFAFLIPFIASKIGNKFTHMMCLLIGGLGLISIQFIDKDSVLGLYGVMAAVGIAWSSILSMPYAMLSGCLPENKIGVYMGIFNFFIVLPEIIAALFFGDFMKNILHNNQIYGVVCGGCLLVVAAILTTRIDSQKLQIN